MIDPDFDPLAALDQLRVNQLTLNNNQLQTAHQVKQLIKRVNEQQQVIDMLIKGLENSNQANELMLRSLVDDINKKLSENTNA